MSLISLINLTDDLQGNLTYHQVSMLSCTLGLLTALIETVSLKVVEAVFLNTLRIYF